MADTTQDLQSFYSNISTYGFSRDFQARIDSITLNGNDYNEDGYLYIKSFSLPGIRKSVATVKYKGVDIHAPGNRDFGNSKSWEVTFYVDSGLVFRDWLIQRLIETAANTDFSENHIPFNDNDSAQVSVYDDRLRQIKTYKIKGLYVVELPNQAYDVSGGGKIQEVKVVFGYQTWEDISGRSSSSPSKPFSVGTLIGSLFK